MTFENEGRLISAAYWPQLEAKRIYWQYLFEQAILHEKQIIMGDFNTGSNRLDKTDKGARFHCAEYITMLGQANLEDAWRHVHSEKREYSWYSRSHNGFRIDHAFVSRSIKQKIRSCWYDHSIREEQLSDHSAMILEMED